MPDAHLGTLWVDIIARDSTFMTQMTKVGNKMTALGIAMTKNVTLPIAVAGAIGYKAAAEIGKGYMLVARQLGITGKALEKLQVRFRKVWRDVPEDSEVVAGVLINVEQRFDATGKAADRMTKKVLDFSRIMGADPVAVSRELGMWFQQNAIKGKKQAEAMDMLAYAAQKSGIPLEQLIGHLSNNSEMLKQLGFNTKQQIALFASFESAGLRAEDTTDALRMAVAKASEEGFKTGEAGLRAFVKQIKEAPNKMAATKVAIEIFGREAGPKLAGAIRQGTFDLDKWEKKLEKSGGTVKKTADATMQLSDRFKMLGKKILGLFEPIGKIFIYAFEDIILPVLEKAANYTDKWADSMDKVPRPVLAAIGTMLVLIALVGPLTTILGWLGNFAILKYGQIAGGIAAIYQFVFLKTAALSYAAGISMGVAFGLILLIILAVAAAIYVVIKHWDKFAKVFQPVIGALAELFKTLKKAFGELWAILKPMLIPALKKLAIIVGMILLGAFGALAIVLILLINIITAIIKTFIGLGKVIYGVAQIMRGFFTGNAALMAEGVKNISDGANEIGGAMKDMVMNSGRQIASILQAMMEGQMAMMDEFMDEGEKKSAKGGKAAGKAFAQSDNDENKKGQKKKYRMFEDSNKKTKALEAKGGKDAGMAYRMGFEEEVKKKGFAGAIIARGRRQQHRQEQSDEKQHQRTMGGIRKRARTKDVQETNVQGGLIGAILRRSHRAHTEEVKRGHNKQASETRRIQGGIIGYLSGVPAKQAFAMKSNSAPIVTCLKPAWDAHVRATQNAHLALGRWLSGIPEFYKAMMLLNAHFIRNMFIEPVRASVRNFKNVVTNFSDNYLANIPRWFKNTILKNVRNMWEAGRKLADGMIRGFINRGKSGSEKSGGDAGRGLKKGFKKGAKGTGKEGKKAGRNAGRGFKQGLNKGAKKSAQQFGGAVINSIKKKLGIKSPSSVFRGMGVNMRVGLLEGLDMPRVREIMREHFKAMVREDTKIVLALPRQVIKIFKQFNKWLARVPRMQRKAMLSQKARHISHALVPEFTKMKNNVTKKVMGLSSWLKGWPKHAANVLKLNAGYMGDAGRVLATKLINAVKNRLGIKSPSKEFENIGSQMIRGLLKGLSFDQVMGIMEANFGGMKGFAQNLLSFMNEHKRWEFLDSFLGISNSAGLYDALSNYLKPKAPGGPAAPPGGGGQLAGVDLVPGQPLMQALFAWIMAQVGGGHSITSGFRPGDPRDHGKGIAIDIAPGSDAVSAKVSQLLGGADAPFTGVLNTPHGQALWKTNVGGNHFNHVHFALRSISDFIRQLAAPKPPPGGGAGGDVWGQIAAYFSARGQGGAQLAPLHELIRRESNFNPQAQNPTSTAWGLFQFLDMHWGPGKYLPAGRQSTFQQQLEGGFRYITERYGNATNALAAHDRQNWYAGGGAVSATLHAGERVLTMQQNRWFSGIARPLGEVAQGAGVAYNKQQNVTVAMPVGTTFKITNLRDGIVEVVDEGIHKHVEKTIAVDEWSAK